MIDEYFLLPFRNTFSIFVLIDFRGFMLIISLYMHFVHAYQIAPDMDLFLA